MDLLELEPDECEGDFLQDDSAQEPSLPPSDLAVDKQDLLDQVFADSGPSFTPSLGDDLSLLDPFSHATSTPASKADSDPNLRPFTGKDVSAASIDDQSDEGFDIFEDSEASLANIESFGGGGPWPRRPHKSGFASGEDVGRGEFEEGLAVVT